MTRETEVRVEKLEHEVRKLGSAINALIERLDALDLPANNVAVVEGDDIEPRATRNGKAQGRKAHR